MVHFVLYIEHPRVLPAWTRYGLASRWDDPSKVYDRQQIIKGWAKDNTHPDVKKILHAPVINWNMPGAYCGAHVIVDYLLKSTGKDYEKLFQLAKYDNVKQGLKEIYQLEIKDLQEMIENSSKTP